MNLYKYKYDYNDNESYITGETMNEALKKAQDYFIEMGLSYEVIGIRLIQKNIE